MSNYSFMRSGTAGSNSTNAFADISQEELMQLINLFISNAMITGIKYANFCGRDGATKNDLDYGLKYEVCKFFERSTLIDDFREIKQDYEDMKNEEPIKFKITYFNSNTCTEEEVEEYFSSEESADEYIDANLGDTCEEITLVELTESDLKMEEMITHDELMPFTKINEEQYNLLSDENKKMVDEIHSTYEKWDSWEPQMPIQKMMKDIVTKNNINNL